MDLELDGQGGADHGGSDGLWRATAARLAAAGARVAICARRGPHLEQAAAELRAATGGDVRGIVADEAGPRTAGVRRRAARLRRRRHLVNNAGTSAARGLDEVGDDAWYADLELKLMAAVRLCRAVVPIMRERGGGAIVNATIVGGKAPAARALPTSVTRAAGINLTKLLANEYAAANIRVNTICIGRSRAPSGSAGRATGRSRSSTPRWASGCRSGRMGEAEDYADLVAFLVSAAPPSSPAPRSTWMAAWARRCDRAWRARRAWPVTLLWPPGARPPT